MPLVGTQRRFEKELRQKSKAACDRLALAIERKSRAAQSIMVQLAKQQGSNVGKNTSTRLLAIELIEEHNRLDVCRILHQSSRTIHDNLGKLIASKSIPSDKDLIAAMGDIHFGAPRLGLFEVEALADLLRRMFGDRFAMWARNNRGCIVNERVVTKLTKPIADSLIDQYLNTITKPALSSGNNKAPVAPSGNPHDSSKPNIRKSSPRSSVFPPPISTLKQPDSSRSSSSSSSVVSMTKLAPTLPIRIFRANPRLEIAFDVRTKNPVYVMERLDGRARTKTMIRHPFYEEERLPREYRSTLCSFIRSGYDRGHMAPAANFGADSVRDTFNLCNVSPQDRAMNRSTWVKLENWCRKVAERELQQESSTNNKTGAEASVHIVTGPVWLPTKKPPIAGQQQQQQQQQQHEFEYSAIGKGDSLIHVPTHFFKVIVVSDDRKIRKFACFLVPNLKPKIGAALEEFIVHWDRLEAITGLQFFPHLATSAWKVEARNVTASLVSTNSSNNGATKGSTRQTSTNHGHVDSLIAELEHLRIE